MGGWDGTTTHTPTTDHACETSNIQRPPTMRNTCNGHRHLTGSDGVRIEIVSCLTALPSSIPTSILHMRELAAKASVGNGRQLGRRWESARCNVGSHPASQVAELSTGMQVYSFSNNALLLLKRVDRWRASRRPGNEDSHRSATPLVHQSCHLVDGPMGTRSLVQ